MSENLSAEKVEESWEWMEGHEPPKKVVKKKSRKAEKLKYNPFADSEVLRSLREKIGR